jgi:hypothetical protein
MGHWGAIRATALAAAVLTGGAPVHAVLPLVAGLGKQIVQNMLIDGVKSQLMGSLSGMGCKGAALASVLAGGKGALMPGLPGAAMPPGLPSGMSMPPGMPMPPATLAGAGESRSIPAARGGVGILNAPPGTDPRAMDMSQLMAMAQQQMGGRGKGTMTPEQMAQVNASMAAMQQAMAQPLSRSETLEVFDELAALGVMTPAMQSEVHDCVTLAPPSATASLGMSGAMVKNMMLPQLRAAHERMANLQPEEREQLANEIAQAMREASPADRKAFQDGFGTGFFPPDVVSAVKSQLR